MSRVPLLACGAVLLAAAAAPAAAQQPPAAPGDVSRAFIARSALQERLDQLERAGRSPVYSAALRARAASDAATIRTRLEDGDFQVADRIVLNVEGEAALSDTFTVAAGRVLQLPVVGAVPLNGILHAELQEYVRTRLSQFIREPRIRTASLMRVGVDGAVTRPGFYALLSQALVSDALMAAGGPLDAGRIEEMRIVRDGKAVWSGEFLRAAIAQGSTLDQLGLRAGDRIVVPQRGGGLGGAETAVRTVTLILSLPLSAFAVTRLF